MSLRFCLTFALFSLALHSCVGPKLQAKLDVVKQNIEVAKDSGAYKCAPKALALAESNADFTALELEQGNFLRAGEHIEVAQREVDNALKNSEGCGPAKVLVKNADDRDGDGIIDKRDACPDEPEDKDGFVDDDGCPDPDNDDDKILDVKDQCPDQREDLDRFEDSDGCPEADNDGDGLLDEDDECPNNKGPVENKGCPLGDKDGDGIADKDDQCPDEAEDKDGDRDEDGCPDNDSDEDGIEDDVDKCPTEKEDKDTFEDEDGCPDLDNDKDGVTDEKDECPLDAGPLESRGCPDKDGDGIADKDDKCPDEVGVAQPDKPERHGCPKAYKLIIVKKDRIEIKQKVRFDSGKAKIKRVSYALLAEVGDAIRNSSLKKVRIEGHTDSRGNDGYNQRLSERRAEAVRTHLIREEGLSSDLLEARGFGEENPIASNRTKKGRAQNRRVEFNVDR